MASLRRKGKVYYVRFRTDDGRQTERKVGPDKSVALKIKRDLETKLVNVKLGLETSQADGERIPISQHVGNPTSPTLRPVDASWSTPGWCGNVSSGSWRRPR